MGLPVFDNLITNAAELVINLSFRLHRDWSIHNYVVEFPCNPTSSFQRDLLLAVVVFS